MTPWQVLRLRSAAKTEAYRAAVLADSPSGYWRLGEVSGTTAFAAAGLPGTYVGGVTLNQPSLDASSTNPSALFNGSSGYVLIQSPGYLSYNRSFSIEALVKRPSSASSGSSIVSHGRQGYYLRVEGAGAIGFLQSQTVAIGSTAAGVLTVGSRNHVVLTVGAGSPANWNIYVNGSVAASGTTSVTFNNNYLPLLIGADGFLTPNQNFSYCNLDEVAIYPTELSAARILAHAQAAGLA